MTLPGDRDVGWADLGQELDHWSAGGREATLWWRDDDAIGPSPALVRLLGLSRELTLPLALAVVPAGADSDLAELCQSHSARVSVVQHGAHHRNNRQEPGKKIELGGGPPLERLESELAAGAARLGALFAARFHAVLVPPWNRIEPALVARLSGLGYIGLSTFAGRVGEFAAPGLRQVNSHVDILRWRGPRGFLGAGACLAQLVGHLQDRRGGQADPREPTGLLTHHLVHDEAAWAFLDELLPRLRAHPAARFLGVPEMFSGTEVRA